MIETPGGGTCIAGINSDGIARPRLQGSGASPAVDGVGANHGINGRRVGVGRGLKNHSGRTTPATRDSDVGTPRSVAIIKGKDSAVGTALHYCLIRPGDRRGPRTAQIQALTGERGCAGSIADTGCGGARRVDISGT